MAYGYRAMFTLLHSYERRYGLNTIRSMLTRYAPPTENFTDGYIRFVSVRTGIAADGQGLRPSPWKRNAKKQNGCLGRPYK